MSVLLKRNLKRIEKFFADNKVYVTIRKIGPKHAKENFTHVISTENNFTLFDALVESVFPANDSTSPNSFAVTIDEDLIICRCCGCSDFNPCTEGCCWEEYDLCSVCAEKLEEKKEVPV